MKILACLFVSLLLNACALTALSERAPSAAPSRGSLTAIIDIHIRVADSDTDEPMEADIVWLDNVIAYRHVSAFTLMIPGDFPATQDGHEIRIRADGYELWTTHIRLRTRVDRAQTLPVHLRRIQPHARLTRE